MAYQEIHQKMHFPWTQKEAVTVILPSAAHFAFEFQIIPKILVVQAATMVRKAMGQASDEDHEHHRKRNVAYQVFPHMSLKLASSFLMFLIFFIIPIRHGTALPERLGTIQLPSMCMMYALVWYATVSAVAFSGTSLKLSRSQASFNFAALSIISMGALPRSSLQQSVQVAHRDSSPPTSRAAVTGKPSTTKPVNTATSCKKYHHLILKADGGGMDDGPDQDPMVPSSRAIVVPGLLVREGFDADGERIGSGHNRYIMVPFGGRTTRFRGPRVIMVYSAVPFGAKPPVRGHIPRPYWQEIFEEVTGFGQSSARKREGYPHNKRVTVAASDRTGRNVSNVVKSANNKGVEEVGIGTVELG
ncbi:hypothetical protein M5K25_018184 [Dendrobium thyrsiflorum]|uniref:Uncharacterized protein n=1 Tax=Dendrobium thyrsiflorum TaxID=117978 RepID=A0ABD0UPJ7_DENTH